MMHTFRSARWLLMPAAVWAVVLVGTSLLHATADAAVADTATWNDATTIYYEFRITSNLTSLQYINIYVNTDLNASTGYADATYKSGGDFLVQLANGTVSPGPDVVHYTYAYSYTGTAGSGIFSWTGVSPASGSINYATGVASISVPRSALGETAACGEKSNVVFETSYVGGVANAMGPPLVHVFSPNTSCTPPVAAALPVQPSNSSLVTFTAVFSAIFGSSNKTVYIDTDSNTATGSKIDGTSGGRRRRLRLKKDKRHEEQQPDVRHAHHGIAGLTSIGADYKLDNAVLSKWVAGAWSVVTPAAVTYTNTATRTTVTWTLARSLLGDAGLCKSSYNVVFLVNTSSTSATDRTPATTVYLVSNQARPAVPMYIYPWDTTTITYTKATNSFNGTSTSCTYYAALMKYMTNTTTLAVLNPASGPVIPSNATYTALVNQYRGVITTIKTNYLANGLLLGYVASGNGGKNITLVQNDITSWYKYYNNYTDASVTLDGIFIDETAVSDCSKVSYYKTLVDFIRTTATASLSLRGVTGKPPAIVAMNPGTILPECYIELTGADIVILFEDTYANYINATTFQPAGYEYKYSSSKIWHLVHSTPSNTASFSNAVALAKSRGAGNVYVTDDILPDPWNTIPNSTYWATENSAARAWGTC